eukprot:SAG11_NODE_10351_length_837_cov_2.035230_1_plen_82_part_00
MVQDVGGDVESSPQPKRAEGDVRMEVGSPAKVGGATHEQGGRAEGAAMQPATPTAPVTGARWARESSVRFEPTTRDSHAYR